MITLRFALDLRLDVVEQQVQAAISAASGLLPTDLPMPPIYRKVNPADAPIITLAVSAPTLPITQVHDLVENRIAQRLAQISGALGIVTRWGRFGTRAYLVPVRVRAISRSSSSFRVNRRHTTKGGCPASQCP